MKRIIFLGFLFMTGWAHAQYESFFGQQTWKYNIAYPLTCKSPDNNDSNVLGCSQTCTFSFNKDSVMNIGDTMYYQGRDDHYIYASIYLREDTVNGKMYGRYPFDEYEREYLICDLSVSVGDTFTLENNVDYGGHNLYWFYYESEGRMLVDSITFPSGKKVIHMSLLGDRDIFIPIGNYNVSYRFMEGIGPLLGICPHNQYYEQSSGFLLCMHKDDELYYMTHEDLGCYQFGVGIDDNKQKKINLYPNPASHTFVINFTEVQEGVKQVRVFDMLGKEVMSIENPSSNTINIANLPTGIYAVRILSQSGRSYTSKLVKE